MMPRIGEPCTIQDLVSLSDYPSSQLWTLA